MLGDEQSIPGAPERARGEQEARLVALACSSPPTGRRLRTLRLLADRMVDLRFVDGVSYETVRRMLKKNALTPWLTERWCISLEASGEFVWRMENVLELHPAVRSPSDPGLRGRSGSSDWPSRDRPGHRW